MISIITVVRNGASTIERTILSVINQDFLEFEYIIVDGVSTDGTLAILDKYSNRINKIISEPDAGIYDAMNKGIQYSTGDWIYFLGCDDIFFDNNTLSRIFFKSNYDKYDVIYGDVEFLHSKQIYDGEFSTEKMCDMSICHQAIFYRKVVFSENGYFRTDYKTASDYIFNISHYCKDITKWHYINTIVTIYNELGASKTIEKKFRKNSFELRYNNFRLINSKYILSKIFWTSFYRHIPNHSFHNNCKYLKLVIIDIGIFYLIASFFKVIVIRYTKLTSIRETFRK